MKENDIVGNDRRRSIERGGKVSGEENAGIGEWKR